MSKYQHILLATDFSELGQHVAIKAAELSHELDIKLSIVHIVEPLLPVSYYVAVFVVDIERELFEKATQQLRQLGKALKVANVDQYIVVGHPKHEIINIAEQINADLIVLGSHGRNPLSMLIGSTAYSIAHKAGCDVLLVRATTQL